MDVAARRIGFLGLAASLVSVVAGCYPGTFRARGDVDGGADGIDGATPDVPDGAMSDVQDGAMSDVADVLIAPDVTPTGTCGALVRCNGNVCPSGQCTTTTPQACDPLGDGIDPDSTPISRGTLVTTSTALHLFANSDASVMVSDSSVFTPGHEALLYVVTGPGAGTFVPVVVHCIASATQIFVVPPVDFNVAATAQVQIVPVLHFTSFGTPTAPTMLSASIDVARPSLGGIIALRVQGQAGVTLRASGYLGGSAPSTSGAGTDGRSSGAFSALATGGHGGVFCSAATCASGGNGGGGANATAGQSASAASSCTMPPAAGGARTMNMTRFVAAFGTGGGSGANTTATPPGEGGAGGGAIFVAAQSIFGQLDVSGAAGVANGSAPGGGGGGGGTIVLVVPGELNAAATMFDARGGAGATGNCEGTGGNGGAGEIRVYCGTSAGTPCGNVGNPVPNSMPASTTHDITQSPF